MSIMFWKIILITSIVLSFSIISCNETKSTILGAPNGIFSGKITMLDSASSVYAEGEITIHQVGETELKGNWKFNSGVSGELVGIIENNQVHINLNPNYVDNNTFLDGYFYGKKIEGTWSFSGIQGIIEQGTFVAQIK